MFCNWFTDGKFFRLRSFLRALQLQKFSIGRNHKTKRSLLNLAFAELRRAGPLSPMPTPTLYLHEAADQNGWCLNLLFRFKGLSSNTVNQSFIKEALTKRESITPYFLYLAPLWHLARPTNASYSLIQMSITVPKTYILPSSPTTTPKSCLPSWPV